jgi:hypothetical protein
LDIGDRSQVSATHYSIQVNHGLTMIVLKLSQKKNQNHRKNKELFNKHPTIDHFATLYAFDVKVRRELKQNSSTSCLFERRWYTLFR